MQSPCMKDYLLLRNVPKYLKVNTEYIFYNKQVFGVWQDIFYRELNPPFLMKNIYLINFQLKSKHLNYNKTKLTLVKFLNIINSTRRDKYLSSMKNWLIEIKLINRDIYSEVLKLLRNLINPLESSMVAWTFRYIEQNRSVGGDWRWPYRFLDQEHSCAQKYSTANDRQ